LIGRVATPDSSALGHGRRDLDHQARVERLRNQVLGAEAQRGAHVGGGHDVALLGLGQLGDRVHRGDLHLIGDGGRARIQRPAEDVREAQDVVDLVGVVRAAGGHDGVVADGLDFLGQDFRRGVGQRKDDRAVGHLGDHVGLEHAAGRQAQEDVRVGDHFGELALVGFLGELRLVRVHQFCAAFVHHARQIGHPDVLARQSELDQQLQAGQGGCASARGDELDVLDVLADDFETVEQGGAHHDGGAVLVVVEDGDLHPLAQLALDVEAVGCLDVLEVDAAEGGFERGDHFDQAIGVLLVDLDVEDVDVGELLEEDGLAFHHRLGSQRADVAQAQHGGAVGDHGHEVAAAGVLEGVGGVLDDLLARCGDAGGVGQGEVTLVGELLGGTDRELAGCRQLVVLERGLFEFGSFLLRCGHKQEGWV